LFLPSSTYLNVDFTRDWPPAQGYTIVNHLGAPPTVKTPQSASPRLSSTYQQRRYIQLLQKFGFLTQLVDLENLFLWFDQS
jgi:hypothetical protein